MKHLYKRRWEGGVEYMLSEYARTTQEKEVAKIEYQGEERYVRCEPDDKENVWYIWVSLLTVRRNKIRTLPGEKVKRKNTRFHRKASEHSRLKAVV